MDGVALGVTPEERDGVDPNLVVSDRMALEMAMASVSLPLVDGLRR